MFLCRRCRTIILAGVMEYSHCQYRFIHPEDTSPRCNTVIHSDVKGMGKAKRTKKKKSQNLHQRHSVTLAHVVGKWWMQCVLSLATHIMDSSGKIHMVAQSRGRPIRLIGRIECQKQSRWRLPWYYAWHFFSVTFSVFFFGGDAVSFPAVIMTLCHLVFSDWCALAFLERRVL